MKKCDVLILGGGPAGMACAIQLYRMGVKKILLIERNGKLGGILAQCIHTGFGLSYYRQDLTGPEFAGKQIRQIEELEIPHMTGTMALEIENKNVLCSSRERGLETINAHAIVIATGCRERRW